MHRKVGVGKVCVNAKRSWESLRGDTLEKGMRGRMRRIGSKRIKKDWGSKEHRKALIINGGKGKNVGREDDEEEKPFSLRHHEPYT